MVQPKEHETYRLRSKPKGILRCEECGVFAHAGRWTWKSPSAGAVQPTTCPACRRTRDRYPAGTLRVHGDLGPLRDELLGLIRNVEKQERPEHPMERLMDIREGDEVLEVTTTGIHLARRLADALQRRLHGKARIHYPPEQNMVQVDLVA